MREALWVAWQMHLRLSFVLMKDANLLLDHPILLGFLPYYNVIDGPIKAALLAT